MASRGILSYGAYLPYRRLDRSEIRAVAGTGGGKGTRTVASYDEDTTTLGVEAARLALAAAPGGVAPASLWFATVSPAYLDKTNATAVHAALRLAADAPAYDVNGAVRSAVGALRAGLASGAPALVVAADMRTGLPGSADEATGGDAGGRAARRVGRRRPAARRVGRCRQRAPRSSSTAGGRPATPGPSSGRSGSARTATSPSAPPAWDDALKAAGLVPDQVDRVVVAASHARAATTLAKRLGSATGRRADLDATVGFTGAAHPCCCWPTSLDAAEPGRLIALVVLADGADVFAVPHHRRAPRRPARRAPWPTRSRPAHPCPTASSWPGGATCRSSRPAGPSRPGPRPRRPGGRATGSSASSAPRTGDGAVHLPPVARATPTGPADGRRRRHGRHVHRRPAGLLAVARRSCSRWSTSTAAGGCRSS